MTDLLCSHLNTSDYTHTAWNRDAYGTPSGTNLYGTHPIYYDHRGENGTHAVFLLNSNGMDFKINDTDGQYLEYNTLGGVLDFYFLAGPSPVEVAQQYSELSQKSALQPYWGLGFHQCKYGYRDVYWVAEVVANYSTAGIPLETMWTGACTLFSCATIILTCFQTSTTCTFAASSPSTLTDSRLSS